MEHTTEMQVARRAFRVHLAGHASTQLCRWSKMPDGEERQRLKRRVGDDALAIRLIAAVADDARSRIALDVRKIAAHGPSLARCTAHDCVATQRTTERNR